MNQPKKKTKISITDRFIYGLIRSYTINDKPFFASNKYIAEELEKSESVISHSISNLLARGFLINKGNKYARQLYTNKELVTADFSKGNADFSKGNADFSKGNAENSISLTEFKRAIAENSNNEMLKTAVANAENSNILYKILISYTNIKEDKEKIDFNAFVDRWNRNAERFKNITSLRTLTADRKKHLLARLEDLKAITTRKDENIIDSFFAEIGIAYESSSFLQGKKGGFNFTLDFVLQKSSFIKLLEGSYKGA